MAFVSHQQTYEALAERAHQRQEPRQRDIFLVLAADAAFLAGQADDAERLRQRLLHHNPHSLLRPFASFAEALASPDIQEYVADLRGQYPPEEADRLLNGKSGEVYAFDKEPPPPRPPIFTTPFPRTDPLPRREPSPREPSRREARSEKPGRVSVYEEPAASPPLVLPPESVAPWVSYAIFAVVLAAALLWTVYVFIAPLFRGT